MDPAILTELAKLVMAGQETRKVLEFKPDEADAVLTELCQLIGVDKETYHQKNSQDIKETKNNDVYALDFIRAIKLIGASIDHQRELSTLTEWHGLLPELLPIIVGYVCIDAVKCLPLLLRIDAEWNKLTPSSIHMNNLIFSRDLYLLEQKLKDS